MKKLSNTEAEFTKALLIKKIVYEYSIQGAFFRYFH